MRWKNTFYGQLRDVLRGKQMDRNQQQETGEITPSVKRCLASTWTWVQALEPVFKKKKSHSCWRALVTPVLRRWIHSNPWNSLVNQSSLLSEFQDCFKNCEQFLRANTWGWPLASVNVHAHTQMCTCTNIHKALRFNYLWIWLSWDISF